MSLHLIFVTESLKQAVGHEAIKLLVNVDEDDYEAGRQLLLQNLRDWTKTKDTFITERGIQVFQRGSMWEQETHYIYLHNLDILLHLYYCSLNFKLLYISISALVKVYRSEWKYIMYNSLWLTGCF